MRHPILQDLKGREIQIIKEHSFYLRETVIYFNVFDMKFSKYKCKTIAKGIGKPT